MRKSHGLTTHSNKFLNIGVPVFNVVVTNGPVHPNLIFQVSFKIQITPSITLLAPDKRTAAYLVTSNPVEPLDLFIRILLIICKKVFVGFTNKSATDLNMVFL